MNCTEQHKLFKSETERVKQLSARLAPEIAACHKAHSDFKAYSELKSQKDACLASLKSWELSRDLYKNTLQNQSNCEKADKIAAEHAQRVDAYEKALASWERSEQNKDSQYAAALRAHQTKVAVWNEANTKYQNYLNAMQGMGSGLAMSFARKMSDPRYARLKDYSWNHRTNMCGTQFQCITEAERKRLATQCTVVKGLGGPVADMCLVREHYPTCPTSCPPKYPHPGPDPRNVVPIRSAASPKPRPPIPLAALLQNAGLGPKSCIKNAVVHSDPGPAPECSQISVPNAVPQPTCVPPTIPQYPVEPQCKPSVLDQVGGSIWLLVAVGAGSIYWIAKK